MMQVFFGGGYPKFHVLPRLVRWGNNLSVFWLRKELVIAWGRGYRRQ